MQKDPTTQFLEAHEAYADVIFRMCLSKTSSRDEAKDLTQETFMRVWERLASGREKIENLRAFLFTVARNLIKDYYKRKKPVLARDLPEGHMEEIPIEATAELQSETKIALSALESLPDAYRETLMLHFVEGYAISEIADMLGERANTISVRVKRGLEKARGALHIEPS